jgi:hypothetical protein
MNDNVIPINIILTPAYIEEVCQTIALASFRPTDFYWEDDEDEDGWPRAITHAHIEGVLRGIAIACGGTSFTDWVMIVKIVRNGSKRMSDDLIYDLKHDRTLPENFDNLEAFRSYLRMENACLEAMRQARPVWKRYQYWLTSQRRKAVRHD